MDPEEGQVNNKIDKPPDESDNAERDEESGHEVGASAPAFVVGIGASAGGIEALIELLGAIPVDTRNAFVVIQHMSPSFQTMLPEILSRQTPHQVVLATEGAAVRPGSFHLIPPGKMLTMFHGRLLVEERVESEPESLFPINHFFESLAKDCGSRAIGVVLSGTGSDGATGTKALRASSGYVIVQSPDSSKFSGMPRSAIATKAACAILPLGSICAAIEDYSSGIRGLPAHSQPMRCPSDNPFLEKVFLALRNQHGIDFSCYREELVLRRMDRRSKMVSCPSLDAYCDYVIGNLEEINALYDDLLLGVTEFNRHPESLQQLKEVVFPEMAQKTENRDTLRVWVVGCSTGEEAFTIAFMVSDYLRASKSSIDFKIFATDVDEKSLRIASRAVYPERYLDNLPDAWKKEYLNIKDGQAQVRTAVRERVVFANHNVIKDAPFPNIHLLTCRNLLIYLKKEIKSRIVRSFRFSLRDGGYLLLGPSDAIPEGKSFDIVHEEARLLRCLMPKRAYPLPQQKVPNNLARNESVASCPPKTASSLMDQDRRTFHDLHEKLVLEHFPAALVFNDEMQVEFYFGDAKAYCRPLVGRASHRVDAILPEDIYSVVRGLFARLEAKGQQVSQTLVLPNSEKPSLLEIVLTDLQIQRHHRKLFLLKFRESSLATSSGLELNEMRAATLQARIDSLEEELKKARTEVVERRGEMAVIIGQLEASNEELRTTNEELQAGSEELQSTNEELQAVNEELYTVNAECQMRIAELSEISSDVQNIYEVSEVGTLFVDRDLRIRKFNSLSQKIFNLLPEDVGRPLGHFSPTMDLDFPKLVRRVLRSSRMYQREVLSNESTTFVMRIAPYRTEELQIKGAVLVFIDISSLKRTQRKLTSIQEELEFFVKKSSDLVVRFDARGRILWANRCFHRLFQRRFGADGNRMFFQDLLAEPDREEWIERLNHWRSARVKEDLFETKVSPHPEKVERVSWHMRAVYGPNGSLRRFISIGSLD